MGRFTDWCNFYGVRPPASALAVAGFLLEMVADGASLEDVKAAAAAIQYMYRSQRTYLDPGTIDAALALAQAQLGPRTLQ
jgi:hypothetical protein